MGGSRDPLTNTAANGVWLCGSCHRRVESHRERAMDQGWLVRQGQDPQAIPVYYHSSRWVHLMIDGDLIPAAPDE